MTDHCSNANWADHAPLSLSHASFRASGTNLQAQCEEVKITHTDPHGNITVTIQENAPQEFAGC